MSAADNKDRLAALDGLRGLAALAVALFHGSSIFNLGWVPSHAYLAVDFFFLLSGYVISRAFDRRLQQGWVLGFLRGRLIRLYPFIVMGSLIGFVELILYGVLARTVSISQAALDLASSLLVIPTPPLISKGWRIFPVDPPLWSLFFEIAANALYAVIAPFLRNRNLWLMVGISGLALACAMLVENGGDFGLAHFKFAGLRVMFSFFLGVAIFRALGPNPKCLATPFTVTPVIALTIVLLAPMPPGWMGDLTAVFAVFPCLLAFALMLTPGGKRSRAVSQVVGLASYPVYAIHLPLFVLAYEALFRRYGLLGRSLGMAATLAAVLVLSWLLAVLYDRPLRRWLTAMTGGRGAAPGETPGRMDARNKFLRLVTERGFASRVLRGRIYGFMRNRLGMAAPMLTEDRRILEQVIFAHFRADPRIKTVLFVGCDSYTAHYQRRYFAKHEYWTLDPQAAQRRFGARQHVVGRVEELGRYFPHGYFDLIILNGVYGWGLNSAADCDAAVSQCHLCLAGAGELLIGWNDLPGRDPAPLAKVRSLSRFAQRSFPAFGSWRYLADTPSRHTFCFFQKTRCNS